MIKEMLDPGWGQDGRQKAIGASFPGKMGDWYLRVQ